MTSRKGRFRNPNQSLVVVDEVEVVGEEVEEEEEKERGGKRKEEIEIEKTKDS